MSHNARRAEHQYLTALERAKRPAFEPVCTRRAELEVQGQSVLAHLGDGDHRCCKLCGHHVCSCAAKLPQPLLAVDTAFHDAAMRFMGSRSREWELKVLAVAGSNSVMRGERPAPGDAKSYASAQRSELRGACGDDPDGALRRATPRGPRARPVASPWRLVPWER